MTMPENATASARPTTHLTLQITLLSDTTFGRGDGVAGLVDAEVQHTLEGLPFVGGRAVRGLLVEECGNLLFALGQVQTGRWHEAARYLFGLPGSTADTRGALSVGDAQLPLALRQAIRASGLNRDEVLSALTTIRRQTSIDGPLGSPKKETLRALRVVLRETIFEASLTIDTRLAAGQGRHDDALALLGACAKSLRRAGMSRHRGRGEVRARLRDPDASDDEAGDQTERLFNRFVQGVMQP